MALDTFGHFTADNRKKSDFVRLIRINRESVYMAQEVAQPLMFPTNFSHVEGLNCTFSREF